MQRQTTFPEFVLFLLIGVSVLTGGVAVSGMMKDEASESHAVASAEPAEIGAEKTPGGEGRAGVVMGTVMGLLIGAVVGVAGRVKG